MASFARSFKPPAAYLSPRRRPGMPGRTLSSSSDLSLTSNQSDDAIDRPVSSAPGTPTAMPAAEEGASAKNSPGASSISSPRPIHSHPIAIELPKRTKKLNTTSLYTPPEPLSARGDVPGGYFPMHEDPKGRVHRPHPFHPDTGFSRHLHSDSATWKPDRMQTLPTSHPAVKSSMAQNMPVSSYLAPGFHDSPLPMGKYYPSNYEQQNKPQTTQEQVEARPLVSDTVLSSAQSDSQMQQHATGSPRTDISEVEARRRMKQYQRDMIAQAALALGGSARLGKSGARVSLNGVPLKDETFTRGSTYKPASPRLDPLGSPGPVTPMELEASSDGYLDKGKRAQDQRPNENLMPPGAGYTAHSM